MLSILETCKLNGVKRLRFLLSGKTDLASVLGEQAEGWRPALVDQTAQSPLFPPVSKQPPADGESQAS
jgi:hypothetical protein